MHKEKKNIRINYLTGYLSPHLQPLLNAFGEHPCVDLKVWYCAAQMHFREWNPLPRPAHAHVISRKNAWKAIHPELHFDWSVIKFIKENECDLTLISEADIPTLRLAIHYLNHSHRPWALRGERPQLWHGSLLRQIAGTLVRYYPLKTARGIIANGTWNAGIYRELCPWGTPVLSVPYYLDTDTYEGSSPDQPAVSFPHCTQPRENNECRFIYVGSLTYRKGVDRLARIFKSVAPLAEHASLYIVGEGPLLGTMKDILGAGLKDRVFFLGNVEMELVPKLLKMSDVFVFPTQFDGWGMVVNEAMACGLPVITTKTCGAAHDLVSDGQNGFLLEPSDDRGFIDKMIYLANNPIIVKQMGCESKVVIARHTPEKGAEILYNVCIQLIGQS